MFARLKAVIKGIFTNRNRRIVAVVVFLNALCGYATVAAFGDSRLCVLCAVLSAFAVAILTMERYLTLAVSCIAAMQLMGFVLFEPAFQERSLPHAALLLLLTAVLTVLLMAMISSTQRQKRFSAEESDRHMVFKATVNSLLVSRGIDNVYETILGAVSALYGRSAMLFVQERGRAVRARSVPEGLIVHESEFDAAQAVFETGLPAGRFTASCTYSPFLHIPLKSSGKVLAVLAILFNDGEAIDQKMQDEIADIISQAVNAIERQRLVDEQQAALIETERQRMRADFLRAISHDIRSPLTGIMSACSTLLQSGERIDSIVRENLLVNIHEEAEWLCHMVENLLSVTRMNDTVNALNKIPELVEDVISEVAARCGKRFPGIRLSVSAPDEPLLVRMDTTLIIQVLMNLIENAVKYGGGSDVVDLIVTTHGGYALFTVRDYGIGLSEEIIGNLFSPINHRDTESPHGLGIGLSICRSIIRAHGGQITGANEPDRGAAFTFSLPMEVAL